MIENNEMLAKQIVSIEGIFLNFNLVSRFWNEMIFYRISELMLPTSWLIQIYDKKSFLFWFSSKTRD